MKKGNKSVQKNWEASEVLRFWGPKVPGTHLLQESYAEYWVIADVAGLWVAA